MSNLRYLLPSSQCERAGLTHTSRARDGSEMTTLRPISVGTHVQAEPQKPTSLASTRMSSRISRFSKVNSRTFVIISRTWCAGFSLKKIDDEARFGFPPSIRLLEFL